MHQDATRYGGRPWPRLHCVRWGSCSPQKGHSSSPLSAHVYCGQTAGRITMPLGTEVGLGPGDIVFVWTQLPPKKGTVAPTQFSAHVYYGQTAGWIKVPLGTEIGLGPGDIVLHRNPAPSSPERGTAAPSLFCPCLFWPNEWMDPDTSWYGRRPRPR